MNDSIFSLLNFLADDATRKACLSGLFYGSFVIGPLCFMVGLRFSKFYIQFLAAKCIKRYDRKKQKNLEKALDDGFTISQSGYYLINPDTKEKVCRNCIENGNKKLSPVIMVNDNLLRCPVCGWEAFVSRYESYHSF